jgi:hypothetical protein
MKGPIWLWISAGLLWAIVAQARGIELSSVNFSQQRLPGVVNPWSEVRVDLRSVGAEGVEDVNVSMALAFERGGQTYYFHGSEKISLIDRTISARFYIPGDIAQSYQLPVRPTDFVLEISTPAGKEELGSRGASAGLTAPDKQKSFVLASKGGRELLPHYKTPFYSQISTLKDLPAYDIP